MRILHLNTYETGGAAKAAIRLHEGLLKQNIDSHIMLLHKYTSQYIENSSVFLSEPKQHLKFSGRTKSRIKNFISRIDSEKEIQLRQEIKDKIEARQIEWFSFPDTGIEINNHKEVKNADIIHIHWTSGFLDYSFFKKNKKPVVWTLHDMEPSTGGCHYTEGCKLFLSNCKVCPLLNGVSDTTVTRRNFFYKKRNLPDKKYLQLVAPSKWMLNQACQSRLLKKFKHYHIPNGVDSVRFRNHEKIKARVALGLPHDKIILLFVAYHSEGLKRKGFSFLRDAIKTLNNDSLFLCSIGNAEAQKIIEKNKMDLGLINDESEMSMAYSAADAFIIPSVEDNLPNTVLESLMCGTPVIGFSVGGIQEMITDYENGFLVKEINHIALSEAIKLFIEKRNVFNSEKIRKQAINKYDLRIQSEAYINLYQKVLQEFN